ncbi:CPBP family intramembrane glutamic endopeptidase [Maricaulis sp. CAU 1757]
MPDTTLPTQSPQDDATRASVRRRTGEVFAGIADHHHETLARTLPGLVVWPALLFAMVIALQFVTAMAYKAAPDLQQVFPGPTASFLAISLAYLGFGAVMWLYFQRFDSHFRVFAIWPIRPIDLHLAGLALLFMVLFAGRISLSFHELVMSDPSLTLSGGARVEDLSNVDNFTGTGAAPWAVLLLVLLIAPVIEEALFRGWMLPMLRARGLPAVIAIILSALAFGLIHIAQGLMVVSSTFLLGLVLGLARVWSGRLVAPILGHVANNAWAVLLAPLIMERLSN